MNFNLDRWIKEAKDDVPDSGEYRRLNRVMLKERMLAANPDHRLYRRMFLAVVILVVLLILSVQFNPWGSDSFKATPSVLESPPGNTIIAHENVVGSANVASGTGTIMEVTGLSYGGKTQWLKLVKRSVNGKVNVGEETPKNPASEIPANHIQFLNTYWSDLKAKTVTDAPHKKQRMAVDGVMLDFRIWTYEYPGFGQVTRYVGKPVDKP